MGKLTKQDVKHVAKLAKLEITENEISKFSKQLSEIITYVEELNQADTANIEPTSQTTGLENVTRKDEITSEETLAQDEALSGSKKVHNGYFVVDAVLTQKDE